MSDEMKLQLFEAAMKEIQAGNVEVTLRPRKKILLLGAVLCYLAGILTGVLLA